MRPAPPVPAELAHRPLDDTGRVVGWATALGDDGRAMQGVNVALRCAEAIEGRLCGQCGTPLGYWIAFLGDEECVSGRRFLEPPMHEACARYAISACPYLGAERYVAKLQRPGVTQLADRTRPERMALYVTRSFEPLYGDHAPMAKAGPPKTVEWF